MKDAYSFDLTEEGLDVSYKKMYDAYCRIFDRMGLDYVVVDADSGAMGGSGSQEFMVKSEVGEDVIAHCEACGYTANEEKAECVPDSFEFAENDKPMEKKDTPEAHTIEQLVNFLGVDARNFAKTIIYKIDGKYVAAMVRGDREVNEVKLKNLVGGVDIELAEPFAVREITHAEVGFAGPIGLEIPVYADHEVMKMHAMVIGANETDKHFINVEPCRDFTPDKVADLRVAVDGDICPRCGKRIDTFHGIEVGHIFKLGTKYAKALGISFSTESGEERTAIMGSYGIGINRCIAAAIEQNSDENGIIWPVSIAPYHVSVIPVNVKDETISALAEKIYAELLEKGIEAIIDDRDERPGVKFKDCDLTGIPLRITVGKKAGEGIVEYKVRGAEGFEEKTAEQAIEDACAYILK
jgi:proline--tRNA ligase